MPFARFRVFLRARRGGRGRAAPGPTGEGDFADAFVLVCGGEIRKGHGGESVRLSVSRARWMSQVDPPTRLCARVWLCLVWLRSHFRLLCAASFAVLAYVCGGVRRAVMCARGDAESGVGARFVRSCFRSGSLGAPM